MADALDDVIERVRNLTVAVELVAKTFVATMTSGLRYLSTVLDAASSHSMTANWHFGLPVRVLCMANSAVMPEMRFAPERLAK